MGREDECQTLWFEIEAGGESRAAWRFEVNGLVVGVGGRTSAGRCGASKLIQLADTPIWMVVLSPTIVTMAMGISVRLREVTLESSSSNAERRESSAGDNMLRNGVTLRF